MKKSLLIGVILIVSIAFAKAQHFTPQMMGKIPWTAMASHVNDDGSFMVVCSHRHDTIIGGDTLLSTFGNQFPWRKVFQSNMAYIEYDAFGKAIMARKIDSLAERHQPIYHLHSNGDLSMVYGDGLTNKYYERQDKNGTVLVNKFLGSNIWSHHDFAFDQLDDGRFSFSVIIHYRDSFFTINTDKGIDTLYLPKPQDYYHHYILMCDENAKVERAFFAYAETSKTLPTTNSPDQHRTNLAQRGDSIWFYESTYTHPNYMLPGNLEFKEPTTAYQGIILSYYQGNMLEFNLHDSAITKLPFLRILEGSCFFRISASKRSLVSTTLRNITSFDLDHIATTQWANLADSVDGKPLPIKRNPSCPPWFAASGLLYTFCTADYAITEPWDKDFTNRFKDNDLLLACYNPDNGQLVNLSKVASNVNNFGTSTVLGEDADGHIIIQLIPSNTQGGYETFTLNGKKYPAGEDVYIVKMKLDKPIISGLSYSQPSCYGATYTVETMGLLQADELSIDWGDGKSTSCTNCYYKTHNYSTPGSYTVDITAVNKGLKTSFSNTAIMPNLGATILPFDTLRAKEDTTLILPEIDSLTYTWSTGQTGHTVQLDSFGLYTVQAKYDSCARTDTFYFLPQLTSLNQRWKNNKIELYPIPAKDEVLFSSSTIDNKPFLVSITDLSGKMILQKKIRKTHTKDQHILDVSPLSGGIYLFTITQNGLSQSTKLVITD